MSAPVRTQMSGVGVHLRNVSIIPKISFEIQQFRRGALRRTMELENTVQRDHPPRYTQISGFGFGVPRYLGGPPQTPRPRVRGTRDPILAKVRF